MAKLGTPEVSQQNFDEIDFTLFSAEMYSSLGDD